MNNKITAVKKGNTSGAGVPQRNNKLPSKAWNNNFKALLDKWAKWFMMKLSKNMAVKTATGRINSIDIFRGITIVAMLIMENPGNPDHVSRQLVHAPWNGLTLADLGFPFFIFIAGASIPFSINRRRERGDKKLNIYAHIIYRSSAIFLAGLFINGFPDFNLSIIRISGPLQRLAVIYLIGSILVLETSILVEAITAILLLVVYYILMRFIQVPGHGAGILAQDGNLAQFVDLQVLKGHMYTPKWDPEGIMGAIPSISTILSGAICGRIISSKKYGRMIKILTLLSVGTAAICLGNYINQWFPINKNLWSSSFVLYTSGLAFVIMGALHLISDIVGYITVFKPFIILGKDPLFIYIGFELVRRTLWMLTMPDSAGVNMPLYLWICNRIITPWAGNINDSYYFSIAYVLLWVLVVKYLRGKRAVEKG